MEEEEEKPAVIACLSSRERDPANWSAAHMQHTRAWHSKAHVKRERERRKSEGNSSPADASSRATRQSDVPAFRCCFHLCNASATGSIRFGAKSIQSFSRNSFLVKRQRRRLSYMLRSRPLLPSLRLSVLTHDFPTTSISPPLLYHKDLGVEGMDAGFCSESDRTGCGCIAHVNESPECEAKGSQPVPTHVQSRPRSVLDS